MKPKRIRKKPVSLKDEEAWWYARLKVEGFQDIEDISKPDRPLKEWHSQKFASQRSRIRQTQRDNYNKMIDNFINSKAINEICSLITKHGNVLVKPDQVKQILELHRDGLTERKIAEKIKCGKKSVHSTIEKARTWMKLAS